MFSRLWYRCCQFVCWTVCKVLFRFRVAGADRVPRDGPVLLLSNHQSHLDPVVAAVACPRMLKFLARDSLFVGPFGWLIRSLGAEPIDRDSSGLRGLRASLRILKSGGAMVLFPEGTRSPDGSLQALKPGFCALARRGGATLVPVGLAGTFDVLPRGARLPRLRRVATVYGEPILPAQFASLTDDALVDLVTQHIREAYSSAQSLTVGAPRLPPGSVTKT